jgi:parallel beta-helix repeat protein
MLLLASLAMPPVTQASDYKVIYVDVSNTGFEDGSSEHPYNTIQEGIDAASASDLVLVAPGVYHEHIVLKQGVVVRGAGAEVTIIDGGGSGKVVTGADNSLLEGFTITGGGGFPWGAGVFCSGSSPTIANNIITGNETAVVTVYSSSPVITHNSIIRNLDGIYVNIGSSPIITNNLVAHHFGGLFIDHASSPIITNNTIVYNYSSFAILNYYFAGSPKITNNIIAYNTVGVGVVYLARPVVSYCLFWGNQLDYWGWGVNENVLMTTDPENDPIEWYNNIHADPMFVDPASDDFRLRDTSPAIDSGSNQAPALPAEDLDGNPRVVDGDGDGLAVVDIGAFEHQVRLIRASIDIDPDTLNLKSRGRWVTCYIELPEGCDVREIDVSTVLLNDVVPAESKSAEVGDHDRDGVPDLAVKFERLEVQAIVEPGVAILRVTGKCGGIPFLGKDNIHVIAPPDSRS